MDDIQPVEKKEVQLSDLKPEWQAFITGILGYKNATESYMAAYPGSEYHSARTLGSQLLANVDIAAVINAELDKRAMAAREIIDRQGSLARANMADIIDLREEIIQDAHGNPIVHNGQAATRQVVTLKPHALENYGWLIKKCKTANNGGLDVELYSAQEALNAMARIRRLVTDNPGNTINVDQVVIMIPGNDRSQPAAGSRVIDVYNEEDPETRDNPS